MLNVLRAALLALLGLTTFANSAAAECAWVLWEHTGHETWTALGAVTTLKECEKKQTRHKRMSDALSKFETKSAPYAAWRCLPDTIDPRGPKGGGR